MGLLKVGSLFISLVTIALMVMKPSPTTAQNASPSPAPSGANATFLELLNLTPDVATGPNALQFEIAEFADIQLQLAAVGATAPTSGDDPNFPLWVRATRWLTLPQDLANRALDPAWREVFGFDVFQVDQSLVAGEPPNMITILRGRFDQNEIQTALTNSGYQSVDIDGLQGYSLFADAEIDFENPASQLALAKMNNAVFLPDGTLAFASTLDLIRQVVAVATGQADSLADRLDVSSLVNAMPRQLASAILIPGSALELTGMLLGRSTSPGQVQALLQEIEQLGQMPQISMALFGVSPGGPLPEPLQPGTPEATPVSEDIEPAVFDIGLLTLTPDQARTAEQVAIARVEALNSPLIQKPYADMFTSAQPAGPADLPVAVIELTFSDEFNPGNWINLIFNRDLLFVGW